MDIISLLENLQKYMIGGLEIFILILKLKKDSFVSNVHIKEIFGLLLKKIKRIQLKQRVIY